jgi:hypothetical protein
VVSRRERRGRPGRQVTEGRFEQTRSRHRSAKVPRRGRFVPDLVFAEHSPMGSVMPAPRPPQRGPLRGSGGAAPRPPTEAPCRAGRQVFRIPDFQVPTHASRSTPTPQERGRMAPARPRTWKPGNLNIRRMALLAHVKADIERRGSTRCGQSRLAALRNHSLCVVSPALESVFSESAGCHRPHVAGSMFELLWHGRGLS